MILVIVLCASRRYDPALRIVNEVPRIVLRNLLRTMFFGTATDKLNIDFLKTRAGVNADFQR